MLRPLRQPIGVAPIFCHRKVHWLDEFIEGHLHPVVHRIIVVPLNFGHPVRNPHSADETSSLLHHALELLLLVADDDTKHTR